MLSSMNQGKVMFCLLALGRLIFAHKVICIFYVLWYLLRNRLKDVLNISKNIGVGYVQFLCNFLSDKFVVLVLLYCIIDQFVVFLCWIIF